MPTLYSSRNGIAIGAHRIPPGVGCCPLSASPNPDGPDTDAAPRGLTPVAAPTEPPSNGATNPPEEP